MFLRNMSLALGCILIFLSLYSVFAIPSALAGSNKEYEAYLKEKGVYSSIVNYLRQARRQKKTVKTELADSILIFLADLLLSFFCLWSAMFLVIRRNIFAIKTYIWFFIILNVVSFLLLWFMRAVWVFLEFLVVNLRPELRDPLVDCLGLILILASVLLFIWLLARSFQLNFFGSFYTFLVSQVAYFLIIAVFFLFVRIEDSRQLKAARESLGFNHTVKAYLADLNKVISGENALSWIKVKGFRI